MKDFKFTLGPRRMADGANIKAHVRFDDECRNGHQSFAITGDIVKDGRWEAGGCIHDDVSEHFPELVPFIKWHLTSTVGPMHYIANTVFWAGEGNLDYARSTAVWPEATDEELRSPDLAAALAERLPALLADFMAAMEQVRGVSQ